jgi:hypothetical protein
MTTTRTAAVTAAIAALVSALLTYFTTKHLTRRRDQIAFVVRQPKKTAACMPRESGMRRNETAFPQQPSGVGGVLPGQSEDVSGISQSTRRRQAQRLDAPERSARAAADVVHLQSLSAG